MQQILNQLNVVCSKCYSQTISIQISGRADIIFICKQCKKINHIKTMDRIALGNRIRAIPVQQYIEAINGILTGTAYPCYAKAIRMKGMHPVCDKSYKQLRNNEVSEAVHDVFIDMRDDVIIPIIHKEYSINNITKNNIYKLIMKCDTGWQKSRGFDSLNSTTFASDAITGLILAARTLHRNVPTNIRSKSFFNQSSGI